MIDFGLADLDKPGGLQERAGTLLYFPPEMLAKERYNRAADLYAMGVTLAVAATQNYPYEVSGGWENSLETAKEMRSQVSLIPPLSDSLTDKMVRTLTALDPKKRWQAVYEDSPPRKTLKSNPKLLKNEFFKGINLKKIGKKVTQGQVKKGGIGTRAPRRKR